jgi:16S rRNA (uracil1498-N3)-methyltransferase
MPNTFYGKKVNEEIILNEDETAHIKTTRKVEGEKTKVITGDGLLYTATIVKIGKKETILEIIDKEEQQDYKPPISVYLGMSKWDRMHLLLEKMVELRANSFYLYRGEKSDINYKNLNKFQRAIIETSKQTVFANIPQINFVKFEEIPKKETLVLDLDGKNDNLGKVLKGLKSSQKINLVVGSEYGFSKREKEFFTINEFKTVNLGKSIFRFETSVIYAMSIINYEYNRLFI